MKNPITEQQEENESFRRGDDFESIEKLELIE